ncbi:hypothetical protein OPV22_008033 [Ensete ventricosum]|uniref:Uncharacterized protein n=1 Tax=Ensete ventricosum TaxID=4639 RepID=A0AAV8RBT0_ENSVE|nr:hypothetical protein OPV22_008033 [Ensete ventricosum]
MSTSMASEEVVRRGSDNDEGGGSNREEELEVALTLDSLPELFLASVHRAALHVLPDSLRWGFRKPRSLPGHPLMSSPPPPPLRDGEKNDDRGVTATATSSPSTPLSFQGSGGSEDIDVRPRPWEEHRKRDIKWVEEQHETMASCADGKANLERVREEYEANPSVLPAAAQLRHEKTLWVTGGDMVPVDPTAVDHRWAQSGSQRPAAGRVGLPDLNVTPDDEEGGWDLVWGWEQQHSTYKAATSALARRRRLQIRRAKRHSVVYDQ